MIARFIVGLVVCCDSIVLAASNLRAQELIEIPRGYARPLNVPPGFAIITVGDPEIVEATLTGNKLVTIIAKKVGRTNLMVFDGENKQLLVAEIEVVNQGARQEFTVRQISGGGGEDLYECGPGPGCLPRAPRAVPVGPSVTNVINVGVPGAANGVGAPQQAGGAPPQAAPPTVNRPAFTGRP